MEIIQILIFVFALFAWSRVLLRFRDAEMSLRGLFFWSGIWLIVILVDFFPQVMTLIANRLGLSPGSGIIVYISILVLFYLVFRIYVMIETQNQTVTKLVRQISIRDAKNGKKKQ